MKTVISSFTQKTDLFLMNSEISVKDDAYDILDQDQVEYSVIEEHMRQEHYTVVDSDREDSTTSVAKSYIEINLRAASIKRVYKREVVDVLTYLGDLGGLLDVLLVVGQMLTSIVASKLFTAALIG